MRRGEKCQGCGAKATRSPTTKNHLAPVHEPGCKFSIVMQRPRTGAFPLGGRC